MEVLMMKMFAIVALLFTSVSYATTPTLSNPLLDHLNEAQVSYIATIRDNVLVVRIISGQFDQSNVANLANLVDFRVKLLDRDGNVISH